MGANKSVQKQPPSADHDATLYYFGGRGLADQLRWLMAFSGVSWVQREVDTREKFSRLVDSRQLAFAQLPLLQIDGMELVQSQAIVRYLAQRGNLLAGNSKDQVKCDMLAESLRDLLDVITSLPFDRYYDEQTPGRAPKEGRLYLAIKLFMTHAMRLEFAIALNGKSGYLVGDSPTYVDVLCAHICTWYVEECGHRILDRFERLVDLQNMILENEGIRKFFRDDKRFYRKSGDPYVKEVIEVLGRELVD